MIGRIKASLRWLPPPMRKVLILVVGCTVLLIGVAMIVLPGPAVVVIPLGLAILSLEFVWAGKLLERAKKTFTEATRRAASAVKSGKPGSRPGSQPKGDQSRHSP